MESCLLLPHVNGIGTKYLLKPELLHIFLFVVMHYIALMLQCYHMRCKVRNCFHSMFFLAVWKMASELLNGTNSKLYFWNLPSKIKMDISVSWLCSMFWTTAKDFKSIKNKINFPVIILPAYFLKWFKFTKVNRWKLVSCNFNMTWLKRFINVPYRESIVGKNV